MVPSPNAHFEIINEKQFAEELNTVKKISIQKSEEAIPVENEQKQSLMETLMLLSCQLFW
jgi:hypothetical protein